MAQASLTSRRSWLTLVAVLIGTALLWYFSAYPRGMVDALVDRMRGRYMIQSYGYPAPNYWNYCRLLKARYGVEVDRVADCCVEQHIEWYAGGYNSVSIPFLNGRVGRDIFMECYQLSEQTPPAESGGE